jgi:hypothetical protein
MHLADEIRRWRQTRRTAAGLPPTASARRVAVGEREVIVVRRRSVRAADAPAQTPAARSDQ